ncbi:MAG TPA: ABC transporter ATP-binding protein [Aggregatilinea sp.]|uniref:ABC transporter ATP-binding protein n=1 Tax=Aggregatilinea sp. TaxID=2806333 RepID=UPI002C7D5E2A|nr:ABC transporter ATP-binding protein [Aggregatilinea sp.]HML20509.1 ABC transporter ATP-binding protein [Aggregatilinea sp.]
MKDELAIKVRGVQRHFGDLKVLRGVNLDVHVGELVALYGPSGSGKTTLINLIGALDRPDGGSIDVLGQDVLRMNDGRRARLRRKQIGFIFQGATLLPTYSAEENIDLALRLPHLNVFERRRRIKAALSAVGLSAWADHMPEELSGGQRQRISIARALALQSPLILADEPTNGIDTPTTRRILSLFRGIAAAQDTTFVIVTHDPMLVDYVDTVYDLSDGIVIQRVAEPEGEQPQREEEHV